MDTVSLRKEVAAMVKGVSRQVIIVKSPDPRLFEQAIFIVKEDAFTRAGVTAEQVVQEACQVASGYIRQNNRLSGWIHRIPAPVYAAAGALITTLAWSLAIYF